MFLGNQPLPPVFLKRTPNYWYTIADGNWNNPAIWSSTGRRKRSTQIPQSTDSVIIGNRVVVNQNVGIVNAQIQGTLVFDSTARTFTVANSFFCSNLDMSTSNAAHNLVLNGFNNWINPFSFTTGTGSTITYSRNGDQNLLDLTYRNLNTGGNGIKNFISNITVNGNAFFANTLLNGSDFANRTEIGNFDLTVLGTTTTQGYLSKTGSGSLVFTGRFTLANISSFNFSGNPNIEFKGGFTNNQFHSTTNSGTGTWTFSTNNQTIDSSNSNVTVTLNCNIQIKDAITVRHVSRGVGYSNVSGLRVNGIVNGDTSTSTFSNEANFIIGNTQLPMQTGVFNYRNITQSGIGFAMNGSISLPYTSFGNLIIGGTSGVKSLSGNTLVEGSLLGQTEAGSDLQIAGYDLQVNGKVSTNGFRVLKNTSTGATIFVGEFTAFSNIEFSGADLELRGNLNNAASISFYANFGSGKIRFTTNNQNIISNPTLPDIQIESVVVSILNSPSITGVINGIDGSSILDNRGTIIYTNNAAIMATGQFKCDQAANTFIYSKTGTGQIIRVPDDVNYRNLTLNGNTSTKTVGGSGTVNVRGTRTINIGVTVVGTITNNP